MTRVIHTGDTHLGYQQYHVPERRADFLAAFQQVVDDAVADDVDAVVHAGDLYHDRRPTLADVLGTLDVLRTLDDAGIPFLAVVGNHETKRDAQWLDLFESMGLAVRLGDEPYVVGDTAFYGLDFVPRAKRDDVDYSFGSHDADYAALVTHGLFQQFEHGTWDATEIFDGSTVDFDVLLLGDDHVADTVQVDGTWLTYCGSTERASVDERQERGYNIVTFDEAVQISRRGLDTREFVFCEVDLAEGEGLPRVREQVGQYTLADAVVIVHIDGEGEPVTPASVEEFAFEEGALVARVTDHRELTTDHEIEVSFADPDDAVRERVRELGLSEAAHDVDETIRASKVADSNVSDRVVSHVRDLLDDGDLSVFDAETPPNDTGTTADTPETNHARRATDSTETNDEPESHDEPETHDPGQPHGERAVEETPTDQLGDPSVTESASQTGTEADGGTADGETPGDEPGSDETADESSSSSEDSGQSSMEEYL